MGLYGEQPLKQLRKFARDLTGRKDVNLDEKVITSGNGKLEIRVRIGDNKAEQAVSDYQSRLETLVSEVSFQEFISGDGGENRGDARLGEYQANLQAQLTVQPEESDMYKLMQTRIEEIKNQRRENLKRYLER